MQNMIIYTSNIAISLNTPAFLFKTQAFSSKTQAIETKTQGKLTKTQSTGGSILTHPPRFGEKKARYTACYCPQLISYNYKSKSLK